MEMRRRSYTAYGIGCAFVWAAILGVLAALGEKEKLRRILPVFGGWWRAGRRPRSLGSSIHDRSLDRHGPEELVFARLRQRSCDRLARSSAGVSMLVRSRWASPYVGVLSCELAAPRASHQRHGRRSGARGLWHQQLRRWLATTA
jgi:hypothetical protein